MGTTASFDARWARARGDPERRFRLRLGALLAAAMALAFAGGGWTVLENVRGEMLHTAGSEAAATLAMHLGETPSHEIVTPPLADSAAWDELLSHYRRTHHVFQMRVIDGGGAVRWTLDGSSAAGGVLGTTVLARALAGDSHVDLGPDPATSVATLHVILPVVFGSATGPAGMRDRGAVEIMEDGTIVAAALRRIRLEVGAIGLLMVLALTALMVHQANLLTLRSFRDRLTGLPNLRHFEATAAAMLPRLARHGRSAAVVVVDLSRLSHVNDALGRRAGDALLRVAADLLRAEIRPGDAVARASGQFMVLLDEADAEGAEAFAQRVLAAMERSVQLASGPVRLHAVAGIAVYPHDGASLDELRAHADSALRAAKNIGLTFFSYRADLAHSTAEALALESDLAAALLNGELVLHGQSVIHMATGAVAGVEALARWQHPERGLLPPGAFVPQAEESGLIRELDRWAFDAAASTVAGWVKQGFSGFLSVNLSAQSLADRTLPEAARLALERHGAPPAQLLVEVTETAAIRDLQASRNVLEALRGLGLRIALDDFGTGYSSLAYLRRLPIDLIKIDRQFTENVAVQLSDQHLVMALLTYARGLGLGVVAEGIETEAQHSWLAQAGIAMGQGYLYGVPGPLDRPPARIEMPTVRARND